MKRYTIFTKDELLDILAGKEVVGMDGDGIRHVYILKDAFDDLYGPSSAREFTIGVDLSKED